MIRPDGSLFTYDSKIVIAAQADLGKTIAASSLLAVFLSMYGTETMWDQAWQLALRRHLSTGLAETLVAVDRVRQDQAASRALARHFLDWLSGDPAGLAVMPSAAADLHLIKPWDIAAEQRAAGNTELLTDSASLAIRAFHDVGRQPRNLPRRVESALTRDPCRDGALHITLLPDGTYRQLAVQEADHSAPPDDALPMTMSAPRQGSSPLVIPENANALLNEGWREDAACRQDSEAGELFLQAAAQNRAKLICRGCPVRTECLADALDTGIEFGVWGGMTERERRALLRRRPDVTSWRELLERARDHYERQKIDELQEIDKLVRETAEVPPVEKARLPADAQAAVARVRPADLQLCLVSPKHSDT